MNSIKNIIFDLNGVLFEKDFTSNIKTISSGINIVNACYDKSYKLFICTNYNSQIIDYLKQEFSEVLNLFNGIVCSSDTDCKKPDIKIFNYLLKKYDLNALESLFLDDKEDNIISAQIVGLNGIVVKNFDEVNSSLKKMNIL